MNTAAIYHRSKSEFAYLNTPEKLHIRLMTAKEDVREVFLVQIDPYKLWGEWYKEIFEQKLPMKVIASTDANDFWQIETGEEDKRLCYAFEIIGKDGEKIFYCDYGIYPVERPFISNHNYFFRYPYFHETDMVKTPDWVRKTVWYQIFPERFWNGDKTNDPPGTLEWGSKVPGNYDFFGGDLQGIINKLSHIEKLGFNGIYLCPIFKSPSNHKYDTIDYFEVDPAFGTKESLKKLVDECHKRGIRVMLDAVFNHIGDKSKEWLDVVEKGAESRYAGWFHINKFPVSYDKVNRVDEAENLSYATWGFSPHMPKLNTSNPEVQEYLLSAAKYWTENFDIDAWRLDVANEVDHHFWQKFRKTVSEIKNDIYIIGEIWHSAQLWLQGNEFHGVMNYPLTESIREYFINDYIESEKMVTAINHQLMLYPTQTNEVMFNLLDSHDTPRLMSHAKGNKNNVKSALAFMFMMTGTPCIYYGTEIAMEGKGDPECRACMEWDESKWDMEMYKFISMLVAFRRKYSDLISFANAEWEVDNEKSIVKLIKKYKCNTVTGVFNNGKKDIKIESNGLTLLSSDAECTGDRAVIKAGGFHIELFGELNV